MGRFSRDVIVVGPGGRPVPRPCKDDYEDMGEFIRDLYAYNDLVTDMANGAFDRQFRKSVRG